MNLEVAFDGKVLLTPMYIKMDAHNQLLLSEGVCSQLGILEYHKNVWPGRQLSETHANQGNITTTEEYQVCLLQSVTIPANKVVSVPIVVVGDGLTSEPLLMEDGKTMSKQCGLIVEGSLLQPDKRVMGV